MKEKLLKMIKSKTKKQYSKLWLSRWQMFVMFWLSVFFIADIYFNHCEHLETLCITLVSSVIATMIPYFAKSYFETKEQKKMELECFDKNIEIEEEILNE